ncbi:MAG: hypothetical protein DM484_00430 [Candidatus Methylumidiphilus alinenensis]|uniref:Uncharacterized protein n=1 Tax=Candidatus Methylumidiphilus alinenensis TaxID=2202197 RepID=A0A2W4S1B3_9GAMM|nr:MAG: hypothetical protein DM484_00430 [Candidatus Methylumidiphilus alinenensis]
MLIINKKQLIAFQPLAERAFISRLIKYFKSNYFDINILLPTGRFKFRDISDKFIHDMIERGIERARQYGITAFS